jgi:hypothetical protein
VAGGAVADARGRATGPEAPLRTYLRAVQDEDLGAAMGEIFLESWPTALPFVAEQLGNQYAILGIGVRDRSLVDRLRGEPPLDRTLLTVQLDITLVTGEEWRTTAHVPVVRTPDGWYLLRPPLQPEEP